MPRKPRLFLPGATYHVYCRVARGEFVFDDRSEALQFIDVVKKVKELDAWTIYAWCLMGNHYHLVLRTRTVDLWRSMARLRRRHTDSKTPKLSHSVVQQGPGQRKLESGVRSASRSP